MRINRLFQFGTRAVLLTMVALSAWLAYLHHQSEGRRQQVRGQFEEIIRDVKFPDYPYGVPQVDDQTAKEFSELLKHDPWLAQTPGATIWAAASGYRNLVELTLDRGGAIDEQLDQTGGTPLAYAVGYGHVDVVQVLLEREADLATLVRPQELPRAMTVMHLAVEHDVPEVLELLLRTSAAADLRCDRGWTALHDAAWWGSVAMARLLLDHGADSEALTDDGRTPCELATERMGTIVCWRLEAILFKPVVVVVHGNAGPPMLDYRQVVEILAAAGATRGVEYELILGNLGRVAKHIDAHPDFVHSHIPKASVASSTDEPSMTKPVIHVATELGHREIVELFLSAGVDVNLRRGWGGHGGDGPTLLYVAVATEQEEIVQLLIERGADVNAHYNWMTPLEAASLLENDRIREQLEDAGAKYYPPELTIPE